MVKYKYKNETVLKEFVGKFLSALAKRKGKSVAKILAKDPTIKKMLKNFEIPENLVREEQSQEVEMSVLRLFRIFEFHHFRFRDHTIYKV